MPHKLLRFTGLLNRTRQKCELQRISNVVLGLHRRGKRIMKRVLMIVALLCALSVGNLLAQTGTSQVSGVAEDASKALIPGVTVTLTNKGTNLSETRVTNESGAYA